MKCHWILLVYFILTGCSSSTGPPEDNTDWPQITRESKPWTRWWWMGNDVDSVNLAYNLAELSKAGIGGVEITPIYGIKAVKGIGSTTSHLNGWYARFYYLRSYPFGNGCRYE